MAQVQPEPSCSKTIKNEDERVNLFASNVFEYSFDSTRQFDESKKYVQKRYQIRDFRNKKNNYSKIIKKNVTTEPRFPLFIILIYFNTNNFFIRI